MACLERNNLAKSTTKWSIQHKRASKLRFWENVSIPVGQKSDLVGRHDGRKIKLFEYFNWVSMPREKVSSSTRSMLSSIQSMYSIEQSTAQYSMSRARHKTQNRGTIKSHACPFASIV